MRAFQVLLVIIFISISGYTLVVGVNHGWNLLPVFFGDIRAMTWSGQFNFDFLAFLILSGLWISWRHHFSANGVALGILGVFLGILFLSMYLLIISFQTQGNINKILLGDIRAGHIIS